MIIDKNHSQYLKQKINSLVSINDDDLDSIVSRFECRKIAKDDFLLREGERCDFWGFIFQGLLRIYMFTDAGDEYTNGFPKEDSLISEFAGFYTGTPSLENIVALEDTILLCVDQPALSKLFDEFPAFERYGRILYENTISQFKRRIHHRIRFDAQTRYLYFIENQAELARRVPLKYIASYLNVTDSTLSRIRRKIVQPQG
jgi:CRP-like cAMP-binding protein